jgi:phosphoribosyl-dephospho-CoA transferase
LLLELQRRAPMRLDGEVILPDGRAVHWLELASAAPELLAKTIDRVVLVRRCDLLAEAGCA